jgi:C-terminal processing protease CtpA/Prc
MDNHRALVLGERTYGKGSVQEVIPLDNKGGELKMTVAYYYLPSGRLVHRKKDATDWGVQPQIVVPMDEETQRKVMEQRYESEIFKRPLPKPTTQSTTMKAANDTTITAPTTQPIDVQLQRAMDTMTGLLVLQGTHNDVAMDFTTPSTQPTTQASQ